MIDFRWRVVAAAVVRGPVLSGCAGTEPVADSTVITEGDGKLLVAAGTTTGMDARLESKLLVLDGGCLGVREAGTQARVAFPAGSDLIGRGGFARPDGVWVPRVPAGCPDDGELSQLSALLAK